ncbi:hypothetical protein P153DRAFT_435973 [Dothidotthia symphoricarpi CBS 119687]|uniref:Zn(2)-C6 fungal-type domain-containing protein n=1 Tax=Dothidotthia symphoricarpi CBS 119687 TaxID=1392245 RepID=A0A6A5ZUQ5_9PLEO|nr:uncharacterized protein P153DRAFT_435973 [Dothidotthia symphoricarpi CBS 119687]KAF2123380.1 hypothetical protein P153DRAFT_435973 [Dothidotthia symphoricarpi CBS 119687]
MIPNTSVIEFPSLKRTQRYGAKVKTGCRTCKIRRVKCDEKKPQCTKCTSTGRRCDGYNQDASSHAVVPSQSSSLQSAIPMLSGLGDSVVYLEFYYHCASPTLASGFDREFWSRIVLQMAQSEPAVRHAVIALGYLAKTQTGSLRHARSVSVIDKTLLLHYNKAVQHLVARISDYSYSIEVGLVACLLFICIEFLRGDTHSALRHLQSGLKIIVERRGNLDTQQVGPLCPSSSITLGGETVGPRIISDNLIPMFIRAMGTGLMFGAPFEPALEPFCPRPQGPRNRPFTSIVEAQSAIYELRNATVVLISIIFRKLSSRIQPSIKDLQYRGYLLTCHESWLLNLQIFQGGGELSNEEKVIASSLKVSHYCTYLALAGAVDIHQTIFDAHISNFRSLNYHAKIVLDSMNLCIPSVPSESSATASGSRYLSGRRETTLASARSYRQAGAHFTFEASIIFPLYFAATRCRCPITRRASVSLLERKPPREGPSDAQQSAVVARRVIEVEESEVDENTGRPVQESRLVCPVFEFDMDKNGGFWGSFTSVAWILRGRDPLDPLRRVGDRNSMHVWGEWDEWFVM